ncbi:MAG: single-stranded DNA-binding protein [Candidatus Nanopelagicales bacterium]
MNDTYTTVIGNLASEVSLRTTASGRAFASFRIASNPRKFNRATNQWVDSDPNYLTVTCWGALAENAQESLKKGDPLVVNGKLKIRQWQDGEKSGTAVEVDATAVGADLARGISTFKRVNRSQAQDTSAWNEPIVDAEGAAA